MDWLQKILANAVYGEDGKLDVEATVRAGKHKGFHWTQGQRQQPFLENAKLEKKSAVERILGD